MPKKNKETLKDIGEELSEIDGGAAKPQELGESPGGDDLPDNEVVDPQQFSEILSFAVNVVFDRLKWDRLNPDEAKMLASSGSALSRKHIPSLARWMPEVVFGFTILVIVMKRIDSGKSKDDGDIRQKGIGENEPPVKEDA